MPERKLIKNEKDILGIKKSAAINDGVLDRIEKEIHVGMSTEEIDQLSIHGTAWGYSRSAEL